MNDELRKQLPELAFLENEISSLKKRLKELEERKSEISQEVIYHFENVSLAPIETEEMKITYVSSSVRTSIDKDALVKEYPEIAKQFKKESVVKASIRIKLKENE